MAAARFYWNEACTRFMLRRFVDIVAQGQKTDKGFKDVHVHLNQVARLVTTFGGRLCTGQQVYNHLRFWRTRWAQLKLCEGQEMQVLMLMWKPVREVTETDKQLCVQRFLAKHYN